MWPSGSRGYSHNSNYKAFGSLQLKISRRLKKLFIGVLMEKKKEKGEKKTDNQYKLKKAMVIAIGLIINV